MFALKKENEELMRELMVAQAQSVQSLAERDSLRADLDDYNSKWNSLTEEFENLYAENERSEKEYERRIAEEKQAFDLIRKKLEEEVSQERKKAYDAEKNYRKAHSEMTNKNSQIAFLTLENATLKHDLEQSKQTCSKYLEENTKLKSELGRISRKDGALYEKFTEKRAQIMQTISGFKDALEKVSSDEESNQADELKSCKEKLKRQNELCKRLMYRLDKMRRKIRKKNRNRKMRSSSRSSSSSVAEHSGSSQRSGRDATPSYHKSHQTGPKTPPMKRRRGSNIEETSSAFNAEENMLLDPLTDAQVAMEQRNISRAGSSHDGFRWTVNSSTSEEEAGGATPAAVRISSPINSVKETESAINCLKTKKLNDNQSKKSRTVPPNGHKNAVRQPAKFKVSGAEASRV